MVEICTLPKLTLSHWFLFGFAAHHTSLPLTTGFRTPMTLDDAENLAFGLEASDIQPEQNSNRESSYYD